jgi:hypothetical protein
MKKCFYLKVLLTVVIFGFLTQGVHAQHADVYRQVVLHVPGLESDKLYQALQQLYEGTEGVEFMLRCKKSGMLVIKMDSRLHGDGRELLSKISAHHIQASLMEGFDYTKAVMACSDFKPE